jgi:histidyl-tRNA synthetase
MNSTLPPKGMRDFMPQEKALREYVLSTIRDEYARNGFTEIETSFIENLENLTGSDGGENTKLIFKILKRGEKLTLGATEIKEDDIADLGLRFDLTLPLSRFYAENRNDLPQVFKAIQMGNVFRAERPQKGRYRSFVQCDVDVIGDETNLTEIELINTVARTLKRLTLKDFVVKVNDRRILKALILAADFTEVEFPDITMTLDKLDKVGREGIIKELESKNYPQDNITKLMTLSDAIGNQGLEAVKELSPEGYENLKSIITVIEGLRSDYTIAFDYSLVRGMGYYTSTIFEVAHGSLGYSIAGGGRYDEMIEKMCGTSAPACGFSIGFERIVDLLKEMSVTFETGQKLALLFSDEDDLLSVIQTAVSLREIYHIVSVFKKKKKLGKQLERLKTDGFELMALFSANLDIKPLG